MLSPEQLKTLKEQLEYLIPQLQTDDTITIEYGDPEAPGGYYSYLRVNLLSTAGGRQLGLREVTPDGREGSGFYTTEPETLVKRAMEQVVRYHRPMNLPLKSPSTRPELSWFPYKRRRG